MVILWDEEALSEADAAAVFYQQKQPGLGQRFLDNLEDAVSRIAHHPYIYRKIEANIRKCKLPHFPYGVIYRMQADTIQIIAVMHLRQEPGYWKHRI
ncbi:hypothetical protein GPROT1_00973 [Gammaproteobacteria bacterium]|nr:hypothetical protein GPROT1_00973 [Gammaproteobacteria bacterium]